MLGAKQVRVQVSSGEDMKMPAPAQLSIVSRPSIVKRSLDENMETVIIEGHGYSFIEIRVTPSVSARASIIWYCRPEARGTLQDPVL